MLSDLSSKVNFFFDGVEPTLRNRKTLKEFIVSIFRAEGKVLESINYIFSSDETVHKINKRYLKHDELTDILTFELSEKRTPIVAEVYISIDRVRENALNHGATKSMELHRVIFHGVLHLCGLTDKTASGKRKMRERENYYLSKYFK